MDKKLKTLEEKLHEIAKNCTLKEYQDQIGVSITSTECCIVINILIVNWTFNVELPLNVLEKNSEDLYNEYMEAIKYGLENHSRDLNLEFCLEPNEYCVKSTPKNIKMDI